MKFLQRQTYKQNFVRANESFDRRETHFTTNFWSSRHSSKRDTSVAFFASHAAKRDPKERDEEIYHEKSRKNSAEFINGREDSLTVLKKKNNKKIEKQQKKKKKRNKQERRRGENIKTFYPVNCQWHRHVNQRDKLWSVLIGIEERARVPFLFEPFGSSLLSR